MHRIHRYSRIGQGVIVSRPCLVHAVIASHDAAGINYTLQDSLNDQDVYRAVEIAGLANTTSALEVKQGIPFLTGVFLETSDTDRLFTVLVSFPDETLL